MVLFTAAQTNALVGFNTRYGCLLGQNPAAALRAFYNFPMRDEIVEAAVEAVSWGLCSSANFQWPDRDNPLRSAPYISSLMWGRVWMQVEGNPGFVQLEEVLRMRGLPAYWSPATLRRLATLVEGQHPGQRLAFIRSMAEPNNSRWLSTLLRREDMGLPARPAPIPHPRRVVPTPQNPVPVDFGPLFYWEDPQGPNGTCLRVSRGGCVTYKYGGSYGDSGTKDMGAVRRAIRAWRAWEKPAGVQLFCTPARPRLAEFYRLFPEVEIR